MARLLTLFAACLFALGACDTVDEAAFSTPPPEGFEDLPIGAVDEMKADGDWGYATECKPIPEREPLADPMVVVSLDGLTLHLFDRAGDYDQVFPIGPGAIEDGESLTPVSTDEPDGVFWARLDAPPVFDGPTPGAATWGWNQQCRMWWTDEDGDKIPVFAGLPFIRLDGPRTNGYGIHGPVDSFTREDGGKLRRGYVSHGCVRMAATDIVEVYARMQGKRVPIRIQRAIERRSDDAGVDVPAASRWIMSECQADTDCDFDGGFCKVNPYSGRGFCTATCTRYCPDRVGHAGTFCVTDPDDASQGICLSRVSERYNNSCRRHDHAVDTWVSRHKQSWVRRDVCLPGTEGWIGDRCRADSECDGGVCSAVDGGPTGICTEPCTRYCPDKDGHAGTFCVTAPDGADASVADGGMCLKRCGSNDECPQGTTCEVESRHGQSWVNRGACLPY